MKRVAHLAFDLGPRHERGDGVDDDAVDAAGADERLGDLERLLAGVRLADEQLVDVDAAGAGVARVEGVLDVDEGDDAAAGLRLGEDVLADGRLARRLRAEDLGDAAARDAADAERQVERDRARRDRVEHELLARSELHDRAAPELLLDRREGGVDRLASFRRVPLGCPFFGHRHLSVTLLIRSIGPLAGGTSQASVRRSAFLCCVVLDDVFVPCEACGSPRRSAVAPTSARGSVDWPSPSASSSLCLVDPGSPSLSLRVVLQPTDRSFTPTSRRLHRHLSGPREGAVPTSWRGRFRPGSRLGLWP